MTDILGLMKGPFPLANKTKAPKASAYVLSVENGSQGHFQEEYAGGI